MTSDVKYDNKNRWIANPADFMGQGGEQGVRCLSTRAHGRLAGPDDRSRREESGYPKPLKGLGSGVFEVALRHRSDAYRVIYAVQIGDDIWVVHAFQKKSTSGIKTPTVEIDIVRERLKRLREQLA